MPGRGGSTRKRKDTAVVLVSLTVQILFAAFLGHYYDTRVFMAAGYSVANGLNPYEQHNLYEAFQHPHFQDAVPAVGYPPPWPLLLGLIHLLSFNLTHNLLVYNLAIKAPVIVGNVILAYFVRRILASRVGEAKARRAWLFILFNPFLLYASSAWGQFDTLVALLFLASLRFVDTGRVRMSAVLLALAVSMKPIAISLIPLPFIHIGRSRQQILRYALTFASTLILLSASPFLLGGWSLQPIFTNWNAHFVVAGGMSFATFFELLGGSYLLPEALQWLGFLWVPAVAIGYRALRRVHSNSLQELVWRATGILFIFLLTRTWVSEPNINLILPLMLIATYTGKVSRRSLHFAWILPFVFTILNTSPLQLLFLVYPQAIPVMADLDRQIRTIRLVARALSVVPWQVLGWRIVVKASTRA